MADEIIDLTRYLRREPSAELPRGSMTLWGGDGERARFALPLWRLIHLAQGDRGLIVHHSVSQPQAAEPFVVLDLGSDPARTCVTLDGLPRFATDEGPLLVDMESGGLAVFLGARAGRLWILLVDGGSRSTPLAQDVREDLLFFAGECAGLLFPRDLADGEAGRSASALEEEREPDA